MEPKSTLSLRGDPFHLDGWIVIPEECRVCSAADPQADTKVTPKAMEVLLYLAERSGQVVSSDTMLDDIWRNRFTGPNAVQKAITEIRKALHDDAHSPRLLKTVPKRGYKLLLQPVVTDPANPVEPVKRDFAIHTRPTKRLWVSIAATSTAVAALITLSYLFTPLGELVESAEDQSCAAPAGEPACPETSPTSIAVLPFGHQDDVIDEQIYANSLSDLITAGLLKVKHLSVASHWDARRFSLSHFTTREVAEQLNVEHLLLGTVETSGSDVRVDVELVDGRTGIEMYRASFTKPFNHLYEFQESIARTVLQQLDVHLDDVKREIMVDTGTTNVEAFLEHQKAAFIVNKNEVDELPTAVAHARRALELDPKYEGAYQCLLVAFNAMAPYIGVENNEVLRAQISEVVRDIEAHLPNSNLHRLALFVQANVGNDRLKLVSSFVARIKEKPDAALTAHDGLPPYAFLGQQLIFAGLHQEGDAYLRAFANAHGQPYEPMLQLFYAQGGLEAAILRRKELIARNIEPIPVLAGLIAELGKLGQFDEAEEYLAQLSELDKQGLWAHGSRHILKALKGELAIGTPAFDAFDRHPLTVNYTRGHIAFVLGDLDRGVANWRDLSPPEASLVGSALTTMERLYPAAILESPTYHKLKNDLGVGNEWKLYLASKVQELEPFTGIGLGAADAQLAGL